MSEIMLYMAGFEVTLHGRFWVSPEGYGSTLLSGLPPVRAIASENPACLTLDIILQWINTRLLRSISCAGHVNRQAHSERTVGLNPYLSGDRRS
jgi:hypothetical protein